MATYILLNKLTKKGTEAIKQSPNRIESNMQLARSLGAEVKAVYLTNSNYDAISVVEAPDDATINKLSRAVAAQGNVVVETLRAFTPTEHQKIVASLP